MFLFSLFFKWINLTFLVAPICKPICAEISLFCLFFQLKSENWFTHELFVEQLCSCEKANCQNLNKFSSFEIRLRSKQHWRHPSGAHASVSSNRNVRILITKNIKLISFARKFRIEFMKIDTIGSLQIFLAIWRTKWWVGKHRCWVCCICCGVRTQPMAELRAKLDTITTITAVSGGDLSINWETVYGSYNCFSFNFHFANLHNAHVNSMKVAIRSINPIWSHPNDWTQNASIHSSSLTNVRFPVEKSALECSQTIILRAKTKSPQSVDRSFFLFNTAAHGAWCAANCCQHALFIFASDTFYTQIISENNLLMRKPNVPHVRWSNENWESFMFALSFGH